MTDEGSGGYKGFRSLLSSRSKSSDPDLNIPVTGGGGLSSFVYDPRILQQIQRDDQYIVPEGQGHRRGRFEMAFTQIGGGCLTGASLGALMGGGSWWKEIKGKDMHSSVKSTLFVNHITKTAAEKGQALGIIALMYSIFGIAVEKSPIGTQFENEDVNSITAGALTGMLFRSGGGLRSSLKGGAAGLTIAAIARAFYTYYKTDF
ncbi:mitochondrial import inner membrane translocase subunit Tim23-like [Dreissena polymorpha]|uniref:Mitochondrial import inner membrane translocase subunit TIM23 n=1 Tax=Dreissena polymorpha TaxID=45954 RepID=A0A9D4LPT1_DREPO|nr:mitochondrial import inner membrane translocase subunit Tim23-like [Dreissena polymorpha]KAH3861955.1 hypothetical protein DPMN_024908 [Dreissena polymorpha]